LKKYKVIQVATGTVGTHGMRTIIGRRDMKLVGLLVFSPDKVGKDAGEMVGSEATGVLATNNFDEILAMDADCVAYNALGETLDPKKSLDNICRLLESGKNVCSTAVSVHIYPSIITGFPLVERLQDACAKGGVSFHSTGINPGYMMDFWPITLSRLSRRIDKIYMTELVDMSRYTSKQVLDFIGFGKPPAEVNYSIPREKLYAGSSFYASMKMLADATGLIIDDITHDVEGVATEVPLDLPTGRIEAGTVAVVRKLFRGYSQGKVRIENQWVWRLSNDVASEWPYGDGSWEIKIEGDPMIETRIDTSTKMDAGQPDVLMTGAHCVNAIPAVCEAPTGICTHLDLPLFGGGFFGAVDERK
jgi:4-hydroxy-tetrahydrodipicolinate reductase